MCCEWNVAGIKQQGESFLCISISIIDDDRSGSEFMSLFSSAFFSITCTQIQFSFYVFLVSFFFVVLLMDWLDVLVSLRVSVSK